MLINVIATIGEFCTRATAGAFEKSEKPYIPRSKRSPRAQIKRSNHCGCAREMLSNHIFGNPRACESKTAPPSKMAGQNDVMKNPEKRVLPQAACASRKRATAKTEISGADSPGT